MALPVNISELVHGKVVEWERLEFKSGWNPEDMLHTVCAFANDINNWGGGYMVIGLSETNGAPQFPPVGVPMDRLDALQGEVISICYKIQPNYLPITQPYEIQGRHILVIWCPAGDMRPYSCPSTLGDDPRRQYYIRVGSRSIVAKNEHLTRLMELTAKVPFDDRIHQEARVNDLDLGLMREFLQEVGSDLFEESVRMPFPDLCKAMQIVRGPVEALRPLNAGLLFFNAQPDRFFKRAWIELAVHKDDSGRNFIPKTFKGPLHKQLRDCLAFLQNEVLKSELRKITGQAESVITSNYPYNAVEEALSNAVYHKSYADEKPIEIQVLPDRMEILSYPGPMPPVTNADLQQRRIIARDYRNRRIGDFLKELKLTEGKSTGFPIILDAMSKNGSPPAVFYTDEERTLFLVTLPCHSEWLVSKSVTKSAVNSVGKPTHGDIDEILAKGIDFHTIDILLSNDIDDVKDYVRKQVLAIMVTKSVTMMVTKSVTKLIPLIDFLEEDRSREEIMAFLEIDNQTKNYQTNIKPLIDIGVIELTIPDAPRSRLQKYRLTAKGRKLLK